MTKKDSRRKKKKAKDTILIICGNTETEKNYFDFVKSRFNNALGKMKIKTVNWGNNSCTPISLLEDAITAVNEQSEIQSCWVICDKDNFNLNQVTNMATKHNAKCETKIYIIWSNISFEIWLLYHFEYMTRELNVDELKEKISRNIKDTLGLKMSYKKSNKTLFEYLEKFEKKAIINSKKSFQWHQRNDKSPNESCSSTMMFSLFDFIEKYKIQQDC